MRLPDILFFLTQQLQKKIKNENLPAYFYTVAVCKLQKAPRWDINSVIEKLLLGDADILKYNETTLFL